ncbi:MAG TPA: LarC family nickel insertion protein [Chloroflexi bacterium]|nr:LarC family nickel insertion protein [Chloroflexota bacterium]
MTDLVEHYDEVALLECNLDDMTGEELGFVLERLMNEGALDVWFTPIYMKKNRPATLLSVLCRPEDGPRLRGWLLRETSTLGVRWQALRRQIADRRTVGAETAWGVVRCKVKIVDGQVVGVKPEFDDCARLAREHGVPLRDVSAAARRIAEETLIDPR